ncbi:KIF26 [Acanthosepion pharaonis]|uniref:KIF26 n=1 Tax=Acanthosepion pharaonis TaxID=158019 RepID=A0A812E4B5_ACAPH|nr:KIF26 [Sepia pharaonis]
MLYSSSLSDPDYTSSSEQSCDTVIYVGANGHSLSDRELTDNEGPPKAVPLLPRTNPRLPRRTSGSRSSGDEGSTSDTGRNFSPVETGRLSINKIYGREPNTQTRIPVMSPTPTNSTNRDSSSPTGNTTPLSASSGYQMAKRANLKQKIPSSKFKALSDSGSSGRHQNSAEGPNFMEQWVDGPGAAIYPDKNNAELWIDGPQAFMVKMENGSRKHIRKELDENGRGRTWAMKRRNGSMSDGDIQPPRSASLQRDEREEEQWVDGPGRGNIRVSNNNYQIKQNAAACHGKKVTSHIPQPAPPSPPDPIPPPLSTMTTGTHNVVNQLRSNKHNQEPRPDSAISADSLSAEPSDSRPASLHSNEQPEQENAEIFQSKPVTAENDDGLNNFVKDWVERHHCNNNNVNSTVVDTQEVPSVTNNGDSNIGTIMDPANQVLPTCESLPCYNKEMVNTQTNQVASMLHKTKITSQETPIGPGHSTNRITEWLKTVSTDENREACVSGSGNSGLSKPFLITESQLNNGSDAYEITNGSADWRRNETVPLIETVSEFNKHMLLSDQCEDNKVWFTEEELTSEQKYLSFYSSADTNKDSNPETEFANLLISNRESIYEIQVDQQLERRSVSGGQDIPDDETFSSISYAKEDAEKLSLEAEAERIQTVQKLKALNAFQDDIPPLRESRTHCQFDRAKLSDLEEVSDEDSVLECKQQLLVTSGKPDNCSNSHLSKEIFDEEEGAIDVSVLKQNYTINPTMSGVYQTNSLFYERNSDNANNSSSSSAVGGHPLPNVNTVPNTLPMYSQIKSAKDGSGTSSQNDAKKSQKTKTSKSGSTHKTQSPSPPTIHKSTNRNQCKDTTSLSSNKQKINKDSSPGCTAISSSVPSKLSASPSSSSSSSHASRGKDRGNKSGRSSSQPAVSAVTRNKTSKSQSPSRSRLPIFNGKAFTPTSKLKKKEKEKKEEKEKMAMIEKTCSPKIHEIDTRVPRRDADTGNETGLVASEKKFLSPYATVTKPRVASHSSSGHGSDNSSTISTEVHSQLGSKSDKLHGGGTSSGYESMLRDSEATGSSSAHDDSASESSSNERKKGTRKKKIAGKKRKTFTFEKKSKFSLINILFIFSKYHIRE